MSKKVKAIITVEIEELDELPPIVECVLENGNKIIIDTARGATTGIDWYDLTENQLRSWGVNFDKLIVVEAL